MDYSADLDIGLLIGLNCIEAIKPIKVIPGRASEPYAVKTALGWGVVGEVSKHRGGSNINEKGNESYSLRTQVKEITKNTSRLLNDHDFNRIENKPVSLSCEDNKSINLINSNFQLVDYGHKQLPIQLPLPLKGKEIPINLFAVLKGLNMLKTNFKSIILFIMIMLLFCNYQTFMNTIKCTNAERAPMAEVSGFWYVPHYGGYHPKKLGNLRVVLACDTNYRDFCFNDERLQFTCRYFGICCLREEKVYVRCFVVNIGPQFFTNRFTDEVVFKFSAKTRDRAIARRNISSNVSAIFDPIQCNRQSYLKVLQVRKKWNNLLSNLIVGYLVIIKEDIVPKGEWKLDKLVGVYPSRSTRDGRVQKLKIHFPGSNLDLNGKCSSKVHFLNGQNIPCVLIRGLNE